MSNETIELFREELTKKSIPLSELLTFKNEIEDAIKILQEDMIKQFRETALASGLELEFLANELVKLRIEKVTPNKKPAKYRNNNNENETWSGHGKKPNWVKEWIDNGNKIEDLEINKSDK
jgi:DNA-binding protein H-NS